MTDTHAAHLEGAEQRATDPVCGMKVVVRPATRSALHDGQTYYFCSQKCLDKFVQEPAKYLTKARASIPKPAPIEQEPPSAGTEYTCPMHPEIVRDAPGSCPICGMALEARTPSAEVDNAELRDMTHRFWIACALSVPVVVLAMLPERFWTSVLSVRAAALVQFILATPVVMWAGWRFFERGYHSIRNMHLNMFTLISIGVGVAYSFSVVALIAPGIFPASAREPDGQVATYFEAAAIITMLVLLGQVLDHVERANLTAAVRRKWKAVTEV